MARFNTQPITGSVTSGGTLAALTQNGFIQLTGTAPYTVTLPSPVLYPGFNQTFYNATAGTVTLTTPANVFTGAGGSGTATVTVPATSTINLVSDGVNYIVVGEDGTSLTATTGSFSGNVTINGAGATLSVTPQTVTIAPGGSSTIDNVAVGSTTRAAGAFTTVAANNAVTFTAGTASSTTGTGSLVVTGGVGVSGNINSGGTVAAVALSGPLTGTIQTAAQPNITSTGSLTIPGLTVSASSGAGGILVGSDAGRAQYQYVNFGGGIGGVDYAWQIGRSPNGGVGPADGFYFYDIKANATRVSINGSGKVGIGTTNPAATLTVKGQTNTAPWLAAERSGSATLQFKIVGAEDTGYTASTGTVSPQWTNVIDNNNSNIMLSTFFTGGTGGKIILDGSVGIGITNPTAHLDISTSDTADTIGIRRNSSNTNGMLKFTTAGTDDWILGERNDSTSNFRLYSYGTSSDVLTVLRSNGNVGIGVTSPQTLLELATTASINSSNYGQIKHLTLSRQENTRYNAYAGFGDQFGGNTFGWRFGTVNNSTDYPTLYMVNGNVGIGTAASPVTRLQANTNTSMASSGSVVDVLSLTDNNGVSNGVTGARIGLTISAQSDITDRRIGIYATANTANFNAPDIAFWASGQGIAYRELVRFSAQTGNVGVGTGANPSAKLHIISTNITTGLKVTSSNDWGNINAPFIDFDGNANGGGDGNILRVKTGAARSDVEIFEVQNGNGTQFLVRGDGNVGIGRTDLAYKLDVNGFARMGSYYAGSTNSTVRLAHMFQCTDLPGPPSIVTNDTGTITQKSAQITTASAGGSTFFFGPYYDLGPGNYQAKFRMKVASNSGSSYMGYIDCVGTNLANTQTVTITPNLFTASNQYQYFNLTFTVTAAGGYVETRWINWQPVTNTSLDHILIIPL